MQFVRDNFMVGIKYSSLADLNGQALAWCNKVTTTNEIPFERLLNPLSREYIIDKINLRRVQKDCLISYAGNQYSVPAEYIGQEPAGDYTERNPAQQGLSAAESWPSTAC